MERDRSVWAAALAALLLVHAPAGAQRPDGVRVAGARGDVSVLRGRVVDARSGAGLLAADLALQPTPAGFLSTGSGVAGPIRGGHRVTTTVGGHYRFGDVTPGRYELRVVRIGYRSTTLEVVVHGQNDPRVSVGLEVDPVRLEPLEVVTTGAATVSGVPAGAGAGLRADPVGAERRRQALHPSPDTRVLTRDDLGDAVTLGETDLLRALHRLPGVTAADDWSAEPWTRGAGAEETRVYFDGLPLYDPAHFGGAFTSVSPDAVGVLTFHGGVRPAGTPEASAAVVDLRTRPATGGDRLAVLGQLSPLAARVFAERPFPSGGGLVVSGRRSFLAELTEPDPWEPPGGAIPYDLADLTGRWDQWLGEGLRLEASGIWTQDRVHGDVLDDLTGVRGEWGNAAGRATIESTRGGLRVRLGHGAVAYTVSLREVAPGGPGALRPATTGAETSNEVRTEVTELSVVPLVAGTGAAPWSVGVRRTEVGTTYEGPAPWPYPEGANLGRLTYSNGSDRYTGWGEFRVRGPGTVDVVGGVELGSAVTRGSERVALRVAPRLSVGWRPSPDLRLTLGVGRHHQHDQAVAPTGFSIGPALAPGSLWLPSGGAVPVVEADMATAGGELWLADGWLVSATAYLRASSGHVTPAPDSGYVRATPVVHDHALGDGWTVGTKRAIGAELSLRKLGGRWRGVAAYSLARSRMVANGIRFPAPGDRRHVLDASLSVAATPSTRVAAFLTAAGGAPFRRFYPFRCGETSWYCPDVDSGPAPTVGFADPPGSARDRGYVSLDLQVEKSGALFGLPFGGYVQLRNALGRDNRSAYLGSRLECDARGENCTLVDRFDSGLPTFPIVGLWIRL